MSERTSATITHSDVFTMSSKHTESDYLIQVGLPPAYDNNPDKTYPVIYLIDGNFFFDMFVGMVRCMNLNKECPEVIVVGIGYPSESFNFKHFALRRAKDLTCIVDERYEKFLRDTFQDPSLDIATGKSASFLSFITQELMPKMEGAFRTDTDDKTLFGHSTGGHFALYTLLNQPETFHRYVIGSPSLGTGEEALFDVEKAYAETHEDLPVRLFMGIGEDEEHSPRSPAGYLGTIVSYGIRTKSYDIVSL